MSKTVMAIVMSAVILVSGTAVGIGVAPNLLSDANAAVQVVTIPEAGNWHSEVKLSDLDDEFPFWARLLIAIAAGNTAFEVDVNVANDGTFSFETNTEKMKSEIGDSADTLLGLIPVKVDLAEYLSPYIDRALDEIMPITAMGKDRDCFGTFVREADGTLLVTVTTGETLRFKRFGDLLVQLDENGAQLLKFEKVS